MNTHTKNKNNRGIIGLLIVIVIAVILLSILGYNPVQIWNNTVIPILGSLWGILKGVIDFVIEVALWIVDKFGLKK